MTVSRRNVCRTWSLSEPLSPARPNPQSASSERLAREANYRRHLLKLYTFRFFVRPPNLYFVANFGVEFGMVARFSHVVRCELPRPEQTTVEIRQWRARSLSRALREIFPDEKRALLEVMAGHKRGPRFKDPDEPRRQNSRVSVLDRARIVDVYRRGGDLKQLAQALGINIKTARSIAATDRQTLLRGGGSKKKFGDDVRPADRNRDDVKHSHKLYAQWLQSDGPRVCRNFGRAAKGQPAVHTTTTTRGANLDIMACMSANSVIHWTAVDRVHWAVFNDFLSDVSARVESEEPNTEAVFIFDGAPAHARAEQAALANSMHSVKRLPAYSSFFNPIEVFLKFNAHVKAYLSERPDLVLATPQGMTKKEHRPSLLLDAAWHSMQQIQHMDCAAFDRHNFSFVPAALREDDL
ncbi:hypothetical protein HPB52_016188 [Rhipicephalus sanguineus]|uniref:Tc1-like transposase DDE domain-containing protein n=1 Tax=Rhipicephalus sanguineus TaxID=34632 RepID=A0A9D4YQG9_RHISA|nr:hypothetical protein HPB52_016188 [Rhipicephalus sanguineus]